MVRPVFHGVGIEHEEAPIPGGHAVIHGEEKIEQVESNMVLAIGDSGIYRGSFGSLTRFPKRLSTQRRMGETGMRLPLFMVGVPMLMLLFSVLPRTAGAHCDSLDGPVISTARTALEKQDVAPVLKWVKKEHEREIRQAFQKTVAVRTKSEEAKDLVDMYFFETLVRIHRAGEGAPYTGLKPAGTQEPGVRASDMALESGSADALVKELTADVSSGLRRRFERTLKRKKHADESVEAGREFVESYVEFVHYAQRLHEAAEGGGLRGHE